MPCMYNIVLQDFQDSSRGIGRGPSTGLDEDFSDEEISHDFNDTSLSDMYQKTKTPSTNILDR